MENLVEIRKAGAVCTSIKELPGSDP